jgi:hypothetical protein
MRRWAAGVGTVVIGAGLLGGCSSGGSSDSAAATSTTPDVCGSADALRTSLSGLGDVKIVQQGTDALDDAWSTVEDDWSQFADDARGTYGTQVDGVQDDADAVRTAADTVRDDSSPQTLAALATAVGAFLQNADALVDEVRSTC